jgi:hypothetical protein
MAADDNLVGDGDRGIEAQQRRRSLIGIGEAHPVVARTHRRVVSRICCELPQVCAPPLAEEPADPAGDDEQYVGEAMRYVGLAQYVHFVHVEATKGIRVDRRRSVRTVICIGREEESDPPASFPVCTLLRTRRRLNSEQ